MKTLKELLKDAARYQAIRASGDIAAGMTGFAFPGYPMNEADRVRLDTFVDNLIINKTVGELKWA